MAKIITKIEKIEMVDISKSVIILYLRDKVLRGVSRENTNAKMLVKFQSLYITKSLPHIGCV